MLIQKDTKQRCIMVRIKDGLRALLIQKDTKPPIHIPDTAIGLRALLIQKDTKHLTLQHHS